MSDETVADPVLPGALPAAGAPSGLAEPPVDDTPPPRAPLDLAAALRQATWVDALCIGGMIVSLLVGLASYPLAPTLLRHVLAHLFVTGSVSALLTGGAAAFNGTLPLWLVVAAGTVGLAVFDPFYFWAGRRYGEHVAHFLESYGSVNPRTVARAERWVQRFGPPLLTASYFLPIPTRLVTVLLGVSGVRWVWFVVADLVGTWAWIAVFVTLGHHFHTEVNHIAHVVSHYSLISTIVLVVLVVVVGGLRNARQQRARSAP